MFDLEDPKNPQPMNVTSPEFLDAKAKALEAGRHASLLRNDPSATSAAIAAAEDEHWRLAGVAYEVGVSSVRDEQEAAQSAEHARLLDERLSKPMEDNIKLALWALTKYGPMTATEISAHRLPGLSHNYVRPVLQLAQSRGLVERNQAGRHVVWSLAS